jgi:hypothetical protein
MTGDFFHDSRFVRPRLCYWGLVERFQNSNHMGPSEYPHFAVTSPKTATDKNHGIDRLVTLRPLVLAIERPSAVAVC